MLLQIYSWTIHCKKWQMDNTGMVQIIIFVQAIFMFENAIWKRHLPFSSVNYIKLWISVNVKRFLLRFAWNSHLQKTINDAMNVSAFTYKGVLRFFRFPQNNIRQFSCVTLIKIQGKTQPHTTSHFFKIIFCRNNKNWFDSWKLSYNQISTYK